MDLTNINHKIYPRAVTASAEGSMRSQTRTQPPHPGNTHSPKPANTPTLPPQVAARQYQEQRAEQGSTGSQRSANDAMVSGFSEQLAASQHARHTHVRRRYAPPAVVTARGREANRRYLDTAMSGQPRIIDEVI